MGIETGTALLIGGTLAAGSSLIAGEQARKGASQAADAQSQAALAGVEEQRRQFDITREDLAPWREAGMRALGTYEKYLTEPSSYMKSPYYNFILGEGLDAIERRASARGKLDSGETTKDLLEYGMGLASKDYGDVLNRYAGLSGIGQTTATTLGQFGMQTAGNIADLYNISGNAQAAGLINQANARTGMYRGISNAATQGINQYLLLKELQNLRSPQVYYT